MPSLRKFDQGFVEASIRSLVERSWTAIKLQVQDLTNEELTRRAISNDPIPCIADILRDLNSTIEIVCAACAEASGAKVSYSWPSVQFEPSMSVDANLWATDLALQRLTTILKSLGSRELGTIVRTGDREAPVVDLIMDAVTLFAEMEGSISELVRALRQSK